MHDRIPMREFRCYVPLWWSLGLGIAVLMWGCFTAVHVIAICKLAAVEQRVQELQRKAEDLMINDSNMGRGSGQATDLVGDQPKRQLTLLTIFYGVCTVYFAYAWGQGMVRARGAVILIDRDAMAISDWRGREKQIHWEDIQQLDLVHLGGVLRPPRIVITTRDGAVKLPPWLREPQQLAEKIVDRARLHDVSDNWFATRYLH